MCVTYQIRPDDHLLGEAEDAKAASLERAVEHVARVRHHLVSLEYPAKRFISEFQAFE